MRFNSSNDCIETNGFGELKDLVSKIITAFFSLYSPNMSRFVIQLQKELFGTLENEKAKNGNSYVHVILSDIQKVYKINSDYIEGNQAARQENQMDYLLYQRWSLQFFDQNRMKLGFSESNYLINLFQCITDSLLAFGDDFNSFRKGTSEAKLQRLSEKMSNIDTSLIEKLQDDYFDSELSPDVL